VNLYWVRSNNFGDALSPVIYKFITGREAVWSDRPPRMLAIGSIAHTAELGDVLWGTGAMAANLPIKKGVRASAVRGPLTDAMLETPCGVYGDPALLLPRFYPVDHVGGDVCVIPHYVDKGLVNGIDPFSPWKTIVDAMAKCDLVISSSLHGIVVAEAYGIPAVWAEFSDNVAGEGFKFRDYYAATDREVVPVDMRGGLRMDNLLPPDIPEFDVDRLLTAFPHMSWRERTKIVAGFIREGESVVDIGCGGQALKEYVGDYVGCDRVGDVDIKCDLNKGLPELPICDVAVMAGVLEYLDDVPKVIEWVKEYVDAIVFSYAIGGNRETNGWVNEYSEAEVLAMLGGEVEERTVWYGQVVARVKLYDV
jgi:pyruvyltransferase